MAVQKSFKEFMLIEKIGIYLALIFFICALGYVLNYVVAESIKDDQ
jgi:hypothetical protein